MVHIIVADDEGALAVDEMMAKANDRSQRLGAAHGKYCPGTTGPELTARLEA